MVLERLDATDRRIDEQSQLLLGHMQGMKSELKQDIKGLKDRIDGLENKVVGLEKKVDDGFVAMKQGFEECRQRDEALEEDLIATMQIVARHEKKLATIRR